MRSDRYECSHLNGENEKPTRCFIQEVTNDKDNSTYILTEHPENEGKHVSAIASEIGDALVATNLNKDPSYKPESLQLYAERPEKGEDGQPRFMELEATTTKLENISTDRNTFEYKADEWRWSDGNRMDKGDLEQRLGYEVPTNELHNDRWAEQQNQAYAEASFSRTDEVQQARNDVAEVGYVREYEQER